MVAQVVPGGARLFDARGKAAVLHVFNAQRVVFRLKRHIAVCLHQSIRHQRIDQQRPQVQQRGKDRVFRHQRQFVAAQGIEIQHEIPAEIKRPRHQPEIAPRFFRGFHSKRTAKIPAEIEEQQRKRRRLHQRRAQRKAPPVALHRQFRKEQIFQRFGQHHDHVGRIGNHQQHKDDLAEPVLDTQQKKRGVKRRAQQRPMPRVLGEKQHRASAQPDLHQRQRHNTRNRRPARKTQRVIKGIERQYQIGQKVEQRIDQGFRNTARRRHQRSPFLKSSI